MAFGFFCNHSNQCAIASGKRNVFPVFDLTHCFYCSSTQMTNVIRTSSFSAYDQKPMAIETPDIKIHSESQKLKTSPEVRKKSIIDSGIELFFRKAPKNTNVNTNEIVKNRTETVVVDKPIEEKKDKWKPFETIKIYTDKRKALDPSPVCEGTKRYIFKWTSLYLTIHFLHQQVTFCSPKSVTTCNPHHCCQFPPTNCTTIRPSSISTDHRRKGFGQYSVATNKSIICFTLPSTTSCGITSSLGSIRCRTTRNSAIIACETVSKTASKMCAPGSRTPNGSH